MNASLISVRYANALFNIGLEKPNLMEKFKSDCQLIISVMDQSKQMDQLLQNATIKPSEKITVIRNVFGSLVDKLMLKFMEVVIQNERPQLLKSMLNYFLDLHRKKMGIKNVQLITAITLSKAECSKIRQQVEKGIKAPIDLSCSVNPDITGGIILIIDGQQIDGSISGQLRQLKKRLMVI
jgi:F-type H+-transporting ATPase subunit delta